MNAGIRIRSVFAACVVVAALVVGACMTGCSGSGSQQSNSSSATQEQKSEFVGYWQLESGTIDGSSFTSDQVDKVRSSGFNALVVMKEDGSGLLAVPGSDGLSEQSFTWTDAGDGYATARMSGSETDSSDKWQLSNGKLHLASGGDSLTFSMISESAYNEAYESLKAASSSSSSSSNSSSSSSSSSDSEVTPELKSFLDEYEAFIDEYVDFMKEYKSSGNVSSLLSKYSSIMSKYSSFMEKYNAIDKDSLSTADAAYYAEVSARVTQKLAEVM